MEENFIPLCRGTLTDWQMAGNGRFHVIGGIVLESEGGPGLLWCTRKSFADFVLYVDWRLCSRLADRQGYEVQIDDPGYDPDTKTLDSPVHLTGAIDKLVPAQKRASRPVGEWNTFIVEAQGHRLAVLLNAELVSELRTDESRPLRGHIGLQAHHPGSRVQFRNTRIREL